MAHKAQGNITQFYMFVVKVIMNTDKQPDEEILEVRSGGHRAEEQGLGCMSQWVWGASPSTEIHSPPQKRSEHHYLGVLWRLYYVVRINRQ